MKLKFKRQQYQEDAAMAIVDCFKGQPKKVRQDLVARAINAKGQMSLNEDIIAFGNHPFLITDEDIRKNIREVQIKNDIKLTDMAEINQFSVEMETGTGKTYAYIKTMYELNKAYGWSKFIVMVPSIAIREGVQKSFEITQEHFQEIYHKKIRFFVYNSQNSSNIANISSFASDDSIQVMIINYQAFGTETKPGSEANRRIYKELDELQSRRPIDVINSVRPILILDEPQRIGDKTEEKLKTFKPLFTIRYSATHKKDKEFNKIYRLDAIDAYNQKLVKKINVKGIEILHGKSEGTYLFLDSLDISSKHDPYAKMEIEVKSVDGVRKKMMTIKAGDDLYTKSDYLTPYKGYVVSEIDAREGILDTVRFTNGVEISAGQVMGDVEIDNNVITRVQIAETIRSHFEKEKRLNKLGIKVLSLFFIDEVKHYRDYDKDDTKGEFAHIFEEEYTKALAEYRDLTDESYMKYLDSFSIDKVHAGYFSIDKKGNLINPGKIGTKSKESDDESAYDLIMKDKERLLSLEEPVRFIFSHSALREGWDNPNVFQICTLKKGNSEISKRQEIGRGLRICVNNDGERMDEKTLESEFHNVNTLTVIASESYNSFSKALQTEMKDISADRPKTFIYESFENRIIKSDDGENEYKFDQQKFNDLMFDFNDSGYIDRKNGYKITDKLIEDVENNELQIPDELKPYKEKFTELIIKLYTNSNVSLTEDARKNTIKTLEPNENFNKKEFQELWNKINFKTMYQVKFNTEELIENAVNKINEKLNVSKMIIKVTSGSQKETITSVEVNSGESMKLDDSDTELHTIDEFTPSTIKYDLLGEIARDTGLTRKTISMILQKIKPQKFELYKANPEEFIRKVSRYINDVKSTIIIEGITYEKTGDKYDNSIFTINTLGKEISDNVIDVKKHIYDYLIADSKTEIEFAKALEGGEVTVYAKLPGQFKIPTPIGNYNPDWAIVINKPDIKYVYFIAETKGQSRSLEFDEDNINTYQREKIECARKHFECLSNENVKYDAVTSYTEMMEKILNK